MTERAQVLGVAVDDLPVEQLVEQIVRMVQAGEHAIVANVNVHAMNIACEQPRFRRFLQRADVVFCDGVGVKLGARLLGQRITHRYTPPDWMPLLAARCAAAGCSLYFLGAREGVAERAADALRATHPTLQIAAHHGYFDRTRGSAGNDAVLADLLAADPDVLVLGMGMPLQEYWLAENWESIPARVAIPAGALFDYLAREVYRAPRWITDNGLEWLARLVVEPRRLWRRYVIGNPKFFWRVLRSKFGAAVCAEDVG